jgi:hypothetical protein
MVKLPACGGMAAATDEQINMRINKTRDNFMFVLTL